MTDDRAASSAEGRRPRVCCCLREGEDRRLLVSWLEQHEYEAVVVPPGELRSASFDCCLLDVHTLRDAAEALREVRESEPALVPCLLVAQGDPADVLARLPEDLAPLVTDVLSTPLRTVVLRRRLDEALRGRQLSLDLATSQERYRRLVEHTPAAVFLLRDGTITYANEAGERLLGQEKADLRGNPFLEFVDADDHDRIASLLEEVADHGAETEFVEAHVVRQRYSIAVELAASPTDELTAGDLTLRDGSVDGPATHDVQVVVHDVSRRKAREDKLRLYRRAMDNATIGITITNPSLPDNPLIYVNEEFETLTGRSREELLGRNARILQSPNTDPSTVAQLREAIDAGESVSVEILNQRADGREWYNLLDVTPIRGADGEVEYFLGFQRDVTDRRDREQRIAVLDRILRHNLRNRLNVVLGHAAEIEDGGGEVADHAAHIRRSAEDLLGLSDAARRFRTALRDGGATEAVRLDEVVENAVGTVGAAHPDARIRTDLEAAVVRTNGGLGMAVEELLTNAITHGTATPRVVVTLERAGGEVLLTVADDGPGIPTEERGPLTGTAETPTEHASGIGLWLVRWVVDDAGGSLAYREREPTGGEVEIRLPAAAESA